jgi:hypothetical protein
VNGIFAVLSPKKISEFFGCHIVGAFATRQARSDEIDSAASAMIPSFFAARRGPAAHACDPREFTDEC